MGLYQTILQALKEQERVTIIEQTNVHRFTLGDVTYANLGEIIVKGDLARIKRELSEVPSLEELRPAVFPYCLSYEQFNGHAPKEKVYVVSFPFYTSQLKEKKKIT